jgi:hypothetical protein
MTDTANHVRAEMQAARLRSQWSMSKKVVWVGVLIGSSLGGYVPTLFGASGLSLWALLGSTIGGVAGVWAGIVLGDRWGF